MRRHWRGAATGWLLLLLAGLSLQAAAAGSAETPRMRRLGAAEGLPSRMVLALAEDRLGYVWAATDDGLARYDGVRLRVWRHEPADPASLPSNTLETLLIDDRDRLWVGSNGGGLSMLDAARQGFQHYPQIAATCPQQVWALAYAQQALWVGTSGTGLCRLDEDGRVTRYTRVAGDPRSLPDDTIYSLLSDGPDRLWIGTADGLARWDGERFSRIAPALLGGRSIIRLSGDNDGGVWAGTDDGLYKVDADGSVRPAPWAQGTRARAAVVLHDRDGGYWMGSANGLFRGDARQLQLLQARLEKMELHLQVSETALAELAKVGFDPVFGARPLKRAIQQRIENPLSKLLLEGRFPPKSEIAVDVDPVRAPGVFNFSGGASASGVDDAPV